MSSDMFHQGDLNSGISRAIREQKLVACFVYQDDLESSRWEHQWLALRSQGSDKRMLGERLGDKAVVLRLELGSQEAAFFNAFCPVTNAPTLAIIQNGQVLEKLEAGIDENDFVTRLSTAAGLDVSSEEKSEESHEDGTIHDASGREPEGQAVTSSRSQAVPERPDESSQSAPEVQQMLNERAIRLEAERKQRDEAEKAQRMARSEARRKEAEEASAAHRDKGKQRATSEQGDKQQARDAWLYQQKQRKDEAKKERERILAQIEADKQERKVRAQIAKEGQLSGDGAFSELSSTAKPSSSKTHATSCSLQVRLFDGSSIRSKFSPDADIATAVRTWIKEASPEGGADQPYTLRQILAPQPSRSIEISEEHQSLRDLGLVPTATLVLVPVAQYTDAYSNANQGYLSSALNGASFLAGAGYNILGSVLSYVPGLSGSESTPEAGQRAPSESRGPYLGGTGDGQEPSNVEGSRMANSDSLRSTQGSAQIRVKTLADQRAEAAKKQGQEFYNGNSLRFEGRDDGDSGKN